MRLRERAGTGNVAKVAVVDDDAELLMSTTRLLEQEGHEVRGAAGADEAVALIRAFRPNLVLLDYYLGNGTGESVVREIRTFDTLCQVLLVTGYAAEQPARKLLATLDIQGYHDKADGPHRLMVLVDGALKHYDALRRIEAQRWNLRHILDVLPSLSKLQPVPELLGTALRELGVLLRGGDGMIATSNSGLFVLGAAAETVSIRAATGRFAPCHGLSDLPASVASVVRVGLLGERPFDRDGWTVVPLRTRSGDKGCMVVEGGTLSPEALEPCELYARQVIQALENVILYEQATVDALTRLHTRDYGLKRLDELMQLGSRTDKPTSVILGDIDLFKQVNDTYGHAAGDLVLREVAVAVQEVCRTTDVVSRYGGEEILVVAPVTDAAGAAFLAEKIRARVASARLVFEGVKISVTASFGVATLPGSESAHGGVPVEDLVKRADRALYRAKEGGRNAVCSEEGRPDVRAA